MALAIAEMPPALCLAPRFLPDLALDGLTSSDLWWRLRRRSRLNRFVLGRRILDAVLEALDRATEIEPRLRSFLVPKINRTMIRTINQCQMLKEPMSGLH
jgi:hypothetical protein